MLCFYWFFQRSDLTCSMKQLLIGQVKLDNSFGASSARLTRKKKAAENQSESRILLLTQLGAEDLKMEVLLANSGCRITERLH